MGKKIGLSLHARNFCSDKIVRTYMYVHPFALADVKCLTYTGTTNCVRLDIRHPCYDQLRAVKIGYALTSVRRLYLRLRLTTH